MTGLSEWSPMATEIERKFLVPAGAWHPQPGTGTLYRQGYLSSDLQRIVRVRIAGDAAFLTVKGETQGISRLEFEYPIPVADAATMLDELCPRPFVEKRRYQERYAGLVWEIDVFEGDNAGLILAEVELPTPTTPIVLPPWVGREVSNDPRYFNSNLVAHPFKRWSRSPAPPEDRPKSDR